MTIPSAYGIKGTGDKLTSGDANTLNADIQMALDKRAGVTDTLASIVTATGAGRIVDAYAFGLNADTTYVLSGGNTIIDASGILTIDRNYTLSNTGAVNGDRCTVIFNSTNCVLNVKNSVGTLLVVLGAYVSGAAGFASVGESSWGDFEWNGAWTLARSAKPAILTPTTFTTSGTWTCPRGCFLVMVIGWGGGGGAGGSGGGSTTVSPCSAAGGGGGGGSMLVVSTVAVTPGTGYACVVGAGGAGGAATLNGSDGADSTFGALVTASGAQGGGGGPSALTGATIVQGGLATRLARAAGYTLNASVNNGGFAPGAPGCGGLAVNSNATTSTQGVGSIQGFNGGSAGGLGATVGTAQGGGAGAGGGSGPGGVGAIGGNGGGGSNTAGAAANGSAGSAATSNTGGGGGGSGGGGQNTGGGTVGAGVTGGNGGSGQLTIIPLR